MQKQCNGKEDSADGSDEKLCSLIRIPNAYDNASAPKYTSEDGNLEIPIDTRIIRIDSIDTINMMVTLIMELCSTWHDERLSFVNPSSDQDDIISVTQYQKLWTPMRDIIHENAIVGHVNYDGHEMNILPPSSWASKHRRSDRKCSFQRVRQPS